MQSGVAICGKDHGAGYRDGASAWHINRCAIDNGILAILSFEHSFDELWLYGAAGLCGRHAVLDELSSL